MDHPSDGTLRVLIVDDVRAAAAALAMVVERAADMICLGTTDSLAEARLQVAEESPDVIVMDVYLPDGDGLEATAAMKDEGMSAAVLILTSASEVAVVLRAAEAGASGLLAKGTGFAVIVDGIRRAAHGTPVAEPGTLAALIAAARTTAGHGHGPPPVLGDEERALLRALAEGDDLAAIAARRQVSPADCQADIQVLVKHLGARSSLEALVRAARHGHLPDPGNAA